MTPDQILQRGILAARRKQQRLTDPADLAALEDLISSAGSEGLILDQKYGIKIRIVPEDFFAWKPSTLK